VEDRVRQCDHDEEHGDAADRAEETAHRCAFRGSRASRIASPRMLNANVTMNRAPAGKMRNIGSTVTQLMASPIERPQLGVGGSTPTPRNDSVASALMRPGSEMHE